MVPAFRILLIAIFATSLGAHAEDEGPAIDAVKHLPAQPLPGTPVVIAATIAARAEVKSVRLAYQVVRPGAYIRRSDSAYEKTWTELPMHDDGKDGDAKAGDHRYSVALPADLAEHRCLVRYRIFAQSADGKETRAPAKDDPCPNFAYFVYAGLPAWTGAKEPGKTDPVTFPAAFMGTLPTFTLIANGDDVEHSQWDGGWNHRRCAGTIVFDGRVYDHVQFRNRGQASTYNTGKNKWAVHFNDDAKLDMRDPTDRSLKMKWDSLSLNACASPWMTSNRGMAGLDEWFSFRMFELAGASASRAVPVQWRVIRGKEEAPAKNQYSGDLWGLYLALEDPDGSFLEERGLPDGNIYKAEGAKKEHQGANAPKDRADFEQFMEKSRHKNTEEWWRENWDLPAYYGFRAANHITGNVDLREGANHFLYHGEKWAPLPWDLDMILVPRTHQSESGYLVQDRCLVHPTIAIEAANRARELLDLLVGDTSPRGGQIGQLIDEYARLIAPPGFPVSWAQVDEFMWNFHPHTSDKGGFYRNPCRAEFGGGSYDRKLATPDFKGMCGYALDYVSNANRPWKLNDGNPRGYGYGFLAADAADPEVPNRPTIKSSAASEFPVDALSFECSDYAHPRGAETFAAVQWRVAQIAAPDVAGWKPGQRWRYEAEAAWTTPEITPFSKTLHVSPDATKPGRTYRARVRMRDNTGRWSRWSEPVTFVTAGGKK